MGGENEVLSRAEAANLLAWWLEAGVDTPVQEEPRNWLKSEPSAPATAPARVERVPDPPPPELPESLDLFRDWLRSAPDLPLAATGGRRVLPQGAEGAPLMLLADAPTGDEASADRPIGGEAWELTQRMLAAIAISADEAYFANISCLHSPGARMSAEDLEACAKIARRHIALAKPKRLLLLGEGPARALLGKPVPVARGHVHSIEGIRTVVTFHPRFLVKTPSSKPLAWKDLLLLMEDMA